MPQMNPIWWFTLFIIFFSMLIISNSMNYFYSKYNFSSSNKKTMNKKFINWKW